MIKVSIIKKNRKLNNHVLPMPSKPVVFIGCYR